MVICVRTEVLTFLHISESAQELQLHRLVSQPNNSIISPLLWGLGVAFWQYFIRPGRCLTSAEVDKWGAEEEVLLWSFTLAHEVLSAETFIPHAIKTSFVCKF